MDRQVCSRLHRSARLERRQAGDDREARNHRPRGKTGADGRPQEISADGEDVAMFAVEVQDAQGRVVPITDNEVTFRVSGAGKLSASATATPPTRRPTKDIAKGLLRLLHGACPVRKDRRQHHRRGHFPGSHVRHRHDPAKGVTLRPQVAVWEREVPTGPGITGLWRPITR